MKDESGELKEERGGRWEISNNKTPVTGALRVRYACVMPQRMIYHPMNGIPTLNDSVASFPSIISKDER